MGSPSSSPLDVDQPEPGHTPEPGSFAMHLPSPPDPPPLVFGDPGEFWKREPKRRYIILFLLTLLSTLLAGTGIPTEAYVIVPRQAFELLFTREAIVHGLSFSLPVLAILGAHEFGHYFACVYYRVNASLPYFLPLPIGLSGTLGAVIRIRQPIPGKRALFDIGIAGPIAGFVVLIPFLLAGVEMSSIGARPNPMPMGLEFGDPLLLKFVTWLLLGPVADDKILFIHPMGMAAWWGMLATALNLFPIGQLDGGHITYAVFGRRSTSITLIAVAVLAALAFFVSMSWIVWTVVTIGMLAVFGPRHPRVWDEDVPLDRRRVWLAAFALLMFILCFTPTPVIIDGVF